MTTGPNRLPLQRLYFVFALALPASLAVGGCRHPAARPTGPAPAPLGPCVSQAAGPATQSSCTLAQRICLIARDLPGTIAQPDFVPAAGYTAHGQSHVTAWLTQLTEIAKEPALESYAQGARRKLDQVNSNEHDRRLIVENGDLLYALKVLGEKAKAATPPIALDCPLPE